MPSGSHLAELNRSREVSIIGNIYGKLTVLKKDGRRFNRHTFLCKCECGNLRANIDRDGLVRGKTKSCGCDFPVGSLGANLSKDEYDEHSKRRFLSKINIINECWEWQGQLNNHGYAVASWGQKGEKRKQLISRVSYLLWKGEFDRSLFVCHRCDNPKCINPDHLFLGTQKENLRDMSKKGRHNTCFGEKCGKSKLSNSQVLEIRKLREEGITLEEIGKRFSITGENVHSICKRHTWTHI